RIEVEERALNAAEEHHFIGDIIEHGSYAGEIPEHAGEPAYDELDPDAGEDDPLALGAAFEEEDVRGVRIKGGSEIDEQETHLVNIAAEMFAGEAVAELMDSAENH